MISLDAFGNIGGRLGSIGVVVSPVHPAIEVERNTERNTEIERPSTFRSIAMSIDVLRSIANPHGDASR